MSQVPARPLNTLAIIAMIAAYPLPVVGIVLGFVARGQIRRRGERGNGLAIGAIVVGIIFTIASIGVVVWLFGYFGQLANICGGNSEGCG